MTMLRPYSTKLARPVPAEFEAFFVSYGWDKVKRMYGKRASHRYFTVSGPARLRAARDAHLKAAACRGGKG